MHNFFISVIIYFLISNISHADRLAILNWETKAPESLDSLSLTQDKNRKE